MDNWNDNCEAKSDLSNKTNVILGFSSPLKDECPVDALRACVVIYLPYILKKQRRVSEKIT